MAKKTKNIESDSAFIAKILLYFILGTLWVSIEREGGTAANIGVPLGLIIGFYFAHHEHFQIDRKIEYVILIASAVVSYFLPIGFVFVI